MALLKRATEEEKAERERIKLEENEQRETERAEQERQRQAREVELEAFRATLPRWEYQVKRVGEDKQKGLLGSQRMEQIFNAEGAKGWELVMINEERATFKRRIP